ncbi:transferrin-binding protein-like solute binding protein [Thauera sinica]|uniref:Transferrin-binding protein-like solute binding protein n=1 Tax=Thauera sinica TaxID=2665146 RepID=A0ABW1ASH6_9RHOO|nr:transferrin-binding protein-like solute binding protein [Thauera sp. K11]ATE61527.1 hypothetical protein CCZ27_17590 [Thauera sp. K11]
MKLSKIAAMVLVGLHGVANNANSAPSGAVGDISVSGAKAEFKAGNKDYDSAVAAQVKTLSEGVKIAAESYSADAIKLQDAIRAQEKTVKELDQKQRKLFQQSNDPQLKSLVSLIPDAVKRNSDEMRGALRNLNELNSSLDKAISSSEKFAKWGKGLGAAADIASVYVDIKDYGQSRKTLVDNMTIVKNLVVAGTSYIPGYGLLISVTDLGVDLISDSLDQGLSIGRKWSLEEADRFRLLAVNAITEVRAEIEFEAKNGVALDTQQIHRIQLKHGIELFEKLSAEKPENRMFDGDVAVASHEESMAFARKLMDGFNLDVLSANSSKLAAAYSAINDYNSTMQELQRQEAEINALIARMEQSVEKLSTMTESLEKISLASWSLVPAKPATSSQPVSPAVSQDSASKKSADDVRRIENTLSGTSTNPGTVTGFDGFSVAYHEAPRRRDVVNMPIEIENATMKHPAAEVLPSPHYGRTAIRLDHAASASQFDYMSWGAWSGNLSYSEPDHQMKLTFGHFIVGRATMPSEMPKSGQASYSGQIIGQYVEAGVGHNDLGGTVNLTANFNTMKIGGGFTFRRGDGSNLITTQLPSSAGAIAGNRFHGDSLRSLDGTDVFGNVIGRFYGNAGKEIGGTVHLFAGNKTIAGIFGAKKQ